MDTAGQNFARSAEAREHFVARQLHVNVVIAIVVARRYHSPLAYPTIYRCPFWLIVITRCRVEYR